MSDNTKAAALRIKQRIPTIKIVMESHDALLFSIPISKIPIYTPIIKEEMERPINFSRCSLPRRSLSIPCDIEKGKNYRDLKKFKDIPIISKPTVIPTMPPKSITEQFLAPSLPEEEGHLVDKVYTIQMNKLDKEFEV